MASSVGMMAALSSLSSSSSSSSSLTKISALSINSNEVSFRSFCSESNSNNKQHLLFQLKGLASAQATSFSRLSQPLYAVKTDIPVTDMKNIGVTLRKAKVVIESREDDTIKVRVDLTGKDTQRVFDDVLTNLARTAPAVPGFRKTKGGKMANVPKDFLVRAIGEARVTKFVIQEIVSTSMTEYVEEEKLNVKKEFKTIQTPEELEAQFEPGKPFWFTADLAVENAENDTTTSSSETEITT